MGFSARSVTKTLWTRTTGCWKDSRNSPKCNCKFIWLSELHWSFRMFYFQMTSIEYVLGYIINYHNTVNDSYIMIYIYISSWMIIIHNIFTDFQIGTWSLNHFPAAGAVKKELVLFAKANASQLLCLLGARKVCWWFHCPEKRWGTRWNMWRLPMLPWFFSAIF